MSKKPITSKDSPTRRQLIDRAKELAFYDAVVNAIQKTDIEEREIVAYEFETGAMLIWPRMLLRGITRDSLLVASLVDAESKLVMRGEKLTHGSLVGCMKFVKSHRPEFFCQTVETSCSSVDNSLKPVDSLLKSH
jgi:hypothetical protein